MGICLSSHPASLRENTFKRKYKKHIKTFLTKNLRNRKIKMFDFFIDLEKENKNCGKYKLKRVFRK